MDPDDIKATWDRWDNGTWDGLMPYKPAVETITASVFDNIQRFAHNQGMSVAEAVIKTNVLQMYGVTAEEFAATMTAMEKMKSTAERPHHETFWVPWKINAASDDSVGPYPNDGIFLHNVHLVTSCRAPCVIHAPTKHKMSAWPLAYNEWDDKFYRICKCRVIHIDPDNLSLRGMGHLTRAGICRCACRCCHV